MYAASNAAYLTGANTHSHTGIGVQPATACAMYRQTGSSSELVRMASGRPEVPSSSLQTAWKHRPNSTSRCLSWVPQVRRCHPACMR